MFVNLQKFADRRTGRQAVVAVSGRVFLTHSLCLVTQPRPDRVLTGYLERCVAWRGGLGVLRLPVYLYY